MPAKANALIFFLLCCGAARGASEEAKVWPVPVEISGTVFPFRILIDRVPFFASAARAGSLKVNDVVVAGPQSVSGTFRVISNADELVFTAADPMGKPIPVSKIELPKILKAITTPTSVRFRVSPDVTRVAVDGNAAELSQEKVTVPVPSPDWKAREHLIELFLKSGIITSRNYRLKVQVKEEKREVAAAPPEAITTQAPAFKALNPKFQVEGSIDGGLTYLFPTVTFQHKIFGANALAWSLGLSTFSSDTQNSTVIDGFVSVNHYIRGTLFQGPWIREGFGLYRFSLSADGVSETDWSPAIEATVGWRWRVGDSFGVGLSAGAQYLFLKSGKNFTLDLSGFVPLFTGDVAWMF